MVKYRYKRSYWSRSFSPFLNFFMVKSLFSIIRKFKSFSPFLNFFMVKFKAFAISSLSCFSP
ncbi:hypothetical protein DSU90_08940, partial [Campylobacter jejuni]|nr:hypothetical protein [Campylobacter jejuni]